MRKLIPLSKLRDKKELDSVLYKKEGGMRGDFDILIQAQRCWDNLRDFRVNRERNKNYCYGDQWGDTIEVDGERMTEENYIKSQGSVPLKNNLIRRLVRTVMGAYRSQAKEPTCSAIDRDEQVLGETMSIALQCNWKINRMSELNGRTFEEFLISGSAFQKEVYGWRNERMDCWTDMVSPNHIFFDGIMRDPRHWDVTLIGEIHDISFEEVCSSFATSSDDFFHLKEIYQLASNKEYLNGYVNKQKSKLTNIDFLQPYDTNLCRVIEIWRKEQKPRFRCHDYLNGDYYKDEIENEKNIKAENDSRIKQGLEAGMVLEDIPLIEYEWFMDDYWYYRFLTPFGHVLKEGETPYKHKSHPYTIKLYPFIDGEIHSFVSDVIDQQRYVNRLITLNDWVIRASAKGVLMFPEECLPEDMTMEDIADEWTRYNGMIIYKANNLKGAVPQQVAQNSTNIGIHEMLKLQMNLMEDVTGVTGALQGKPGYSGMSAALYSQQQQNASSSLLDIMESFSSFTLEGAIKKVKNMQQFYDTKRVLNIVGKNATGISIYDPEKINDVEFDLNIVESTSTPVYRMIANDFLMEIWKAGQISVEQLLQNGNFPFADNLLNSIKAQKEQIERGGQVEGLPDVSGANEEVVNKLSR